MKTSAAFRTVLLATALIGVAAATPVQGGHDARDQEIARRALKEGRIRSLSEITEQVRDRLPGKILGVELEVEHGRIVYEFDVIDPSGRLMEVEVDAASGEILSIEDDD